MSAVLDRAIDVESRVVPDGEAPASDAQEAKPAVPVVETRTALARFDPIAAALNALREKIASTSYDINTTAGEKTARELRQLCVQTRTSAEKLYKELNAPLLAVQKGWREKVKQIEDGVTPLEDPIDAAIKAKERAQEEERLRKIEVEKARIAALRVRISAIAAAPAAAVSMDAAALEQAIINLQDQEITEGTFEEFVDEAVVLRGEVIAQLKTMLQAKVDAAAERARLSAQAAEQEAERRRQALEVQLRAKIDAIKARAFDAMGKSSVQIAEIQTALQKDEPQVLVYGDLQLEAQNAWRMTVGMVDSAFAAQAAAELRQAEQIRLSLAIQEEERQRAEQRKRDDAELAARRKAIDDEEAERKRIRDQEEADLVAAATPVQVAAPAPEPEPVSPVVPLDSTARVSADPFAAVVGISMLAEPARAKPGPWLRRDDTIFRCASDVEVDMIVVTCSGGSDDVLRRCNLAQTILDVLLKAEKTNSEEIPS